MIVHALAASMRTGGHLVLALGVLPGAMKQGSAMPIRQFKQSVETLGLATLAAIAIQLFSSLAMAWI